MPLFSLCAYARRRGVSKQAVSTAVKQGRIPTVTDPADGKRKIDSDVVDALWAIVTDDRRRPLSERVANAERAEAAAGPETQTAPATRKVSKKSGARSVQEYADARAEREGLQAKLTRIELGKKSGDLVSAKAVESEAFRLGRVIRDNLLNIPDRVSHQLAAESDPVKVHEMLRAEIHQVLEALTSPPDPGGLTQDQLEGPEPKPARQIPASNEVKKMETAANHANP